MRQSEPKTTEISGFRKFPSSKGKGYRRRTQSLVPVRYANQGMALMFGVESFWASSTRCSIHGNCRSTSRAPTRQKEPSCFLLSMSARASAFICRKTSSRLRRRVGAVSPAIRFSTIFHVRFGSIFVAPLKPRSGAASKPLRKDRRKCFALRRCRNLQEVGSDRSLKRPAGSRDLGHVTLSGWSCAAAVQSG